MHAFSYAEFKFDMEFSTQPCLIILTGRPQIQLLLVKKAMAIYSSFLNVLFHLHSVRK